MIYKLSSLYLAQLLRAILPLLFIPLIINEIGIEQYGLVSFMLLLLSFLGLLDAGINGGMIRLLSISKNNIFDFRLASILWNKVSYGIIFIALLLLLVFNISAEYLALNWFESDLPVDLVERCVKVIGIILSLSFLRAYLASKLIGYEKQVQLSFLQIFITTFQYFIPYLALKYLNYDVDVYFVLVAFFIFLDCIFLCFLGVFYTRSITSSKFDESEFKEKRIDSRELTLSVFFKNSLHLSGLTILWTLATQLDKLALSKYYSIETFSYYQIAGQVALSINLLIMPVSQYLMPRLSSLYSSGDYAGYADLLIKFFNFFVIFLAIFSPLFFFYGEFVIGLWLNDSSLTENVYIYLKWLLFAALIQSMSNFIFIYYYSTNRVKLQFYAYLTYSAIIIPGSIFFAINYGAEACSIFSFVSSLMFFIIWGGFTIKKHFFEFKILIIKVSVALFAASSLFIYFINIFFFSISEFIQLGFLAFLYSTIYFVILKLIIGSITSKFSKY